MNILKSFLPAILSLGIVVASPLMAFAGQDVLNFGIISTEASQNLKVNWEPFLKRMEEETGLKINAFFAPDYAGIITGMQYDKVQVAWFGNKSAMEAVDRANGEVFAQTMDMAGLGGYFSHLIVHKDSPLNTLEDVLKNAKELTFSNGDPNSTSGFLVPGYYVFSQNKIDPKTAFKRTLTANHEANAMAVLNKHVDVATISNETLAKVLAKLGKSQPEKANSLKIVWTSPLIPSDPLVWRKDLPEDTKNKIRNFLFNFGVTGPRAEEDKAILAALTWAPFKPSTDDQLLPIRQLEIFKNRNKVEQDNTLHAAEKKAKLTEIDKTLHSLEKRIAELKKKP